ncbi:NAD(P)/FAD-dependent oxidoreductase [Pantoea sp. 1.19]|uniref:NAD(P)/FAD-dependent oxidoreductase n=1 Tax=Pantoea sp. 1.19 TaxID=1925589 RepID=UPI000948A2CA|nr:FAD-dependent oxidoreductase [Pantoea sp. 1.19]
MKIAVIGSGIAGLSCCWKLAGRAEVDLYESADRLGGHTATVDVTVHGRDYAVDTGFIVFNDRTYPRFLSLLAELGIASQPTEMSFSVDNPESGLCYNGHSLNTLFAQRRNLLSPSFYGLIGEILRFNRRCKAWLTGTVPALTLGDFLDREGFSPFFARHYILPMGAAIWSGSLARVRDMPLSLFLQFFNHHGLLDLVNRPQWYVIPGGSRHYIEKLLAQLDDRISIRLNTPVRQVRRSATGVTVSSSLGDRDYDQVIFACHSDQSLAMLADPCDDERAMLSAIPWQANPVVLHTDTRLLPRERRAWASWNYQLDPQGQADNLAASVTYNMNILQGIRAPETFCVTLNPRREIDPKRVLGRFVYHHPQFGPAAPAAQQQRLAFNGRRRTWYCGAWCYNGFHEDGVRSALDVIAGLDEVLRG